MTMKQALMFDLRYLKTPFPTCRKIKFISMDVVRLAVYLNLLCSLLSFATGNLLFLYIQAYSAPFVILSVALMVVLSYFCQEPDDTPKDKDAAENAPRES